jgi:hypothetical protein
MSDKTIWKVVKVRYAPSYDYRTRPATFQGYYPDKQETVYREGKSAVTNAVNYARKANEDADKMRAAYGRHQVYYRVEVTEVIVTEVSKGPRVIPDLDA